MEKNQKRKLNKNKQIMSVFYMTSDDDEKDVEKEID